MVGARCVKIGMSASDMNIQMKGPYSNAIFAIPYFELSVD